MFRSKKTLLFVLAVFVSLQFHATSVEAGKVVKGAKVAAFFWKAVKGDVENNGSDDAYFGLLFAEQFSSLGDINIDQEGELYINGIAINDAKAGLIYIQQNAQFLDPVFVQTGGYAALNQVIVEKINGGAVIISQDLESRGTMNVGHGATLEVNNIKINGTGGGR